MEKSIQIIILSNHPEVLEVSLAELETRKADLQEIILGYRAKEAGLIGIAIDNNIRLRESVESVLTKVNAAIEKMKSLGRTN